EPMTLLKFTGEYDAYGQPVSQVTLAVPRGRDAHFRDATAGEPYLATHERTDYAQRDDEQVYIVDRVARTTSHELLNDGSVSVFALLQATQSGTANSRINGQTLHFYDGPAFQGLPVHQIGTYGALVRSEQLVLTPDILHEAYKSGAALLSPPEVSPYLSPG